MILGQIHYFSFRKGDDVQKVSVIQSLPKLLSINSQAVQSRVIPKIQQDLPTASAEFNIIASKTFKMLIEKRLPIDMMNTVYQGIESKDPVVSNAWFDTLIGVVPALDESQIKHKLLPLAKEKTNLNQPIYHRVASCKIFGEIGLHPKFSPLDVKKDILPIMQSLCQDCHPEVRAVIVVQIPKVMKALGASPEKAVLLPCLVELSSDEKVNVRAAAVTALVGIFPYISNDTIKDTIVPLVKQLYEKGEVTTDSATVVLAKEFGKIMTVIEPYLNSTTSEWYLKCYKSFSAKGKSASVRETLISQDVLCRDHCAANLPAFATFTLKKVPEKFELFYGIFKSLSNDPCFVVRRSVAENFHVVAKILGPKNSHLKPEFISLLKDDVDEILQALVEDLDVILEHFTAQKFLSKRALDPSAQEIGNALLKCQIQLTKSNHWRLLANFLNRMQYLPNCMPSDYLHQHFTPVILNIALQGRAKPVKLEACRTLLWFLRNNAKETQKQWLLDNLISQMCYSASFYARQTFINLCADALQIFNNKFFKDYFYIPFISLIDDKVSNIRYGVVRLLPQLRLILGPQDTVLHKLFNNAVTKLKAEEKDRDVKQLFNSQKRELEGPIPQSALDAMQRFEKKKLEEQTIYIRRVSDTIYIRTILPPDISSTTPVETSAPKRFSTQSGDKTFPGTQKITPLSQSSSQKSIPSQKSVTASNMPSSGSKSDMTFLEQHFYVDAGIIFPSSNTNTNNKMPMPVQEKTDSLQEEHCCNESRNTSNIVGKASTVETDLILQKSTNITDDDKYELKLIGLKTSDGNNENLKAEKKLNGGVLNKRHSSIYSISCIKNTRKKTEHRRSLNINTKENSRIPISSKTFKQTKLTNENDEINKEKVNNNKMENENGILTSEEVNISNKLEGLKKEYVREKHLNYYKQSSIPLPEKGKKLIHLKDGTSSKPCASHLPVAKSHYTPPPKRS